LLLSVTVDCILVAIQYRLIAVINLLSNYDTLLPFPFDNNDQLLPPSNN